jgi:hypothetical protein
VEKGVWRRNLSGDLEGRLLKDLPEGSYRGPGDCWREDLEGVSEEDHG